MAREVSSKQPCRALDHLALALPAIGFHEHAVGHRPLVYVQKELGKVGQRVPAPFALWRRSGGSGARGKACVREMESLAEHHRERRCLHHAMPRVSHVFGQSVRTRKSENEQNGLVKDLEQEDCVGLARPGSAGPDSWKGSW